MTRITRYAKRIKYTLFAGVVAASAFCIIAFPFLDRNYSNKTVGYYSVRFNGEQIGNANSLEDAEKALAQARLRFSRDYDSIIYTTNNIDIVKETHLFSGRMSQQQLADEIYASLFNSVKDKQLVAYSLRIGQSVVTLSTKDDVISVLDAVMDRYDEDDKFKVELSANPTSKGDYGINISENNKQLSNADIIAGAIDGGNNKDEKSKDELKSISFMEKVSVMPTLLEKADVISTDEAVDRLTQTYMREMSHIVEKGETLQSIAESYDVDIQHIIENNGLTEDTILIPGDKLNINIENKAVAVQVVWQRTYDEEYDDSIQYIDDETEYRGTNTVVNEGSSGERTVTADITYINGVRTATNVISELITQKAEPKVVKVGILTTDDYIKPIDGGELCQNFGIIDGQMHDGVDWVVDEGTQVKASAAGEVVRSMWYSDKGYCVDILHEDGKISRYSHLSGMTVRKGDKVTQGQLIAYTGSTGNCYRPLLHFEIIIDGKQVNPLYYVNKK